MFTLWAVLRDRDQRADVAAHYCIGLGGVVGHLVLGQFGECGIDGGDGRGQPGEDLRPGRPGVGRQPAHFGHYQFIPVGQAIGEERRAIAWTQLWQVGRQLHDDLAARRNGQLIWPVQHLFDLRAPGMVAWKSFATSSLDKNPGGGTSTHHEWCRGSRGNCQEFEPCRT